MSDQNQYTEDNIRSLDWKEHIRMRPGMYIGKLGDGSSPDDGIYILLKEVLDNCIDEFVMGAGVGLDLLSGNDKAPANRVALYDSTATVDDLFDKISLNGKTHSGGDRSGDLPKANIELWMAQEEACK